MKTTLPFFVILFISQFANAQVGINTTTPQAMLHVLSTAEPSTIIESTNDSSLRIKSNANLGQPGESYIEFENNLSATNGWMIGTNDDSNFYIGYRALGSIGVGVGNSGHEFMMVPSARTSDYLVLEDYNPGGVADGMVLRPNRPNYSSCGTVANYFDDGYFSELYRDTELVISDRRTKYDIQNVSNALSTINQLQGVHYKINTETHPFYKNAKEDELLEAQTKHFGFIAQDLKAVIPEMVVYNKEMDLNIVKNYEQLLPFLVEGLKELNSKVGILELENKKLKAELDLLKK